MFLLHASLLSVVGVDRQVYGNNRSHTTRMAPTMSHRESMSVCMDPTSTCSASTICHSSVTFASIAARAQGL